MGINFFDEQVPDATTLFKFRHLLERHSIGKMLFDAIARALAEHGLAMTLYVVSFFHMETS